MAEPSPDRAVADALPDWLTAQRWYAGKGRHPVLDRVARLRWPAGPTRQGSQVGIETWLVRDTSGEQPTLYQVPLTYRDVPLPGAEQALVATLAGHAGGQRYVYDGAHDPAFARALLSLVLDQSQVGSADPLGTGTARGHRRPGAVRGLRLETSRVLGVEQSNTSLVAELRQADGSPSDPLLLKLFRVLHPGQNPDVAVQSTLADAGSRFVPRPVGHVSGSWPDDDRTSTGDLAFVQEFLPDAQDAWQAAVQAADQDQDHTDAARRLGQVVAEVHRSLAVAFPARPVDPQDRTELLAGLLTRLDWAQRQVPELRTRAAAAERVLRQVETSTTPGALQRIHGDLHLGQLLDGGPRGWVLIDFEGEPLRPFTERSRPSLPLRDVAGMLRSFDYAAAQRGRADGSGAVGPDRPAGAWAQTCRDAFCRGYGEVADADPRHSPELLHALELDKALYEAVYEARNRPDWLGIPLAAVDRLTALDQPTAVDPEEAAVPAARPVQHGELTELVHGSHGNPHGVLGLHRHDGALTLRTLRPQATEVVAVLPDGARHRLQHEEHGVFVGVLPGTEVTEYRLDVTYRDGAGAADTHPVDDPYRFLPTLGEIDLHLIGEGRHEQLWTVLGAQVRSVDGAMGSTHGTSFAVWAPHARGVRLVCDANHWDGTAHPMRSLGSTGVWELFVPGIGPGTRYKFEITGPDGHRRLKADPFARATQQPPATASVVTSSGYTWQDDAWMDARAGTDPHAGPMSTYEVHLGSWRAGLSYLELADQLVGYLLETGFTHVELMPVMEHPYGPSWGYQVSGYYAPTARFGSPDEFRHLVDRLHQAGIGVILDWVPAHFPRDAFALATFDGEALYEHPDPRRGDQPDWGTHVFDLSRPQVRNFLVANAVYWCEEFHVDGLRVDAVASMLYLDYSRKDGEWLPNEHGGRENLDAVAFLQEMNATVYRRVPGVLTIAEESTAWPGVTRPTHLGGLGFGLKWNMGWMHDSLSYVQHEPVHRQWHHHELTFSLVYAWSESYLLPISHDEVVHGKGSLLRKMPGDRWQQLATVRAYLAFMWAHPGKQLLFMGSEFAQEAEWADAHSLDWWLLDQPAHRGVHTLVRDLNSRYRELSALWSQDLTPDGFRWIDANDAAGNVFSFLRIPLDPGEPVLACVVNFSGAPHQGYRLGLPTAGTWTERLNTDAEVYGGSGVGNLGTVPAETIAWHGLPASAVLDLPPLGALWLTAPPAS